MKKITILGNFSGRNAGDAAILGNILEDFSHKRNDIKFIVPTINTNFIKTHFGNYNVLPVGLLPWNGAIKIFGIPTFRSMLNTDMILITDNILFDRKFYNPVFNYLSTISLIAPFCKKKGIPIILYNASLGPINSNVGKTAISKIMDASPLLILRDEQSKEMLENLSIKYPSTELRADCAINTIPSDNQRIESIIKKEGLFTNSNGTISFNINSYIDNWSNSGTFSHEDFLRIIGNTIDSVIETLNVDVMYTVTQLMDLKITMESFEYLKHKERVKVISNKEYTYRDIAGLLERVGTHIGLRTHPLIFSAAVYTPMISINSYPKSIGFMKTIKQEDWMIDFKDLTTNQLKEIIIKSWNSREERKKSLESIVAVEKQKAKNSVDLVLAFLKN